MKKILIIYILLSAIVYSKDIKVYYLNEKLRTHFEDNDLYNNKADLEGIELVNNKGYGILYLRGINSFYDEINALAVTRKIDSKINKLSYWLGAGGVMGYKRENIVHDKHGNRYKITLNQVMDNGFCPLVFIGISYKIYDRVLLDLTLIDKAILGTFRIEI